MRDKENSEFIMDIMKATKERDRRVALISSGLLAQLMKLNLMEVLKRLKGTRVPL